MDSEIDKFLQDYGDKNIYIRYNENKNKFDTEEISNHLQNYIIN